MQHFVLAVTFAVASAALAIAATGADWRFDPKVPPAGLVIGKGAAGVEILMECASAGTLAIGLAGLPPLGREAVLGLSVDGAEDISFSARCQGDGCALILDPPERARLLLDRLGRGRQLRINRGRGGMVGEIPLGGAGAAVAALQRTCERLD